MLDVDQVVTMWMARGHCPDSKPPYSGSEIRICPPGHEESVGAVGWGGAAALIYSGEKEAGKWVSPPRVLGYITVSEAKFIAKVMETMEQAKGYESCSTVVSDLPPDIPPRPSQETNRPEGPNA